MNIVIHTDGGSRGNPGSAAYGYIIEYGGKIIQETGVKIGIATNNIAEYSAVKAAFEWLANYKKKHAVHGEVHVYSDSTLVVNQLNGIFKIKDGTLRNYIFDIKLLEQEIGESIYFHYIPREQNAKADMLVNAALDSQ
jgi:ribonuclease HI